MNKTFTLTIIASALSFSAVNAQAAAFQLAEVSTSGLGTAYAGNAAVIDNASVIATNPALMTHFQRPEISAGGILADTDITVRGTSANGNNAYAGNIIPTSLLPNLYFVAPLNDKLAVGLGYNVNFGLRSEFKDDYNAGTLGGKTELEAHNLNLSAAYKLGHGFSFGAGLNVLYSKAELRRTLGDMTDNATVRAGAAQARAGAQQAAAAASAATAAGATAQAAQYQALAAQYNAVADSLSNKETELARIKGDKWSTGWNVGLAYELNENHRWGLAYHSAIDVKFKGQFRNSLVTDLPSANGTIYAMNGQETDGKLVLNLPAYWEFSGWHKVTDRLAMQYSWKRTEWSRLKTLDAYSMDDSRHYLHKTENFRDTNRYAFGLSYEATPDLTLRTGIAYDRNASVDHPSISIPDSNRVWYSVGATYKITRDLSVDAGYTYIRGTKFSFNEEGAAFESKARANLYGLNLNYKF